MMSAFFQLWQRLIGNVSSGFVGNDNDPLWYNGVGAVDRTFASGDIIKYSDGVNGVATGSGQILFANGNGASLVGNLYRINNTVTSTGTSLNDTKSAGVSFGLGDATILYVVSRAAGKILNTGLGSSGQPTCAFTNSQVVNISENANFSYTVLSGITTTLNNLKIVVLRGGFNSAGVPILPTDTNTAAFGYGFFCYVKWQGIEWSMIGTGTAASSNNGSIQAAGYVTANTASVIDVKEFRRFSATGSTVPDRSLVQSTVHDQFNDTNGTAIASHTPSLGGAWTLRNGTITIQGNAAIPANTLATTTHIATLPGDTLPFIQANVVYDSAYLTGVVFAYVDNNNYTRVEIGNGVFQIVEMIDGNPNTRATASPSLTAGTSYLIRAWRDSTSLRAVLRVNATTAIVLTPFASTTRITASICGVFMNTPNLNGATVGAVQDFTLWPRNNAALNDKLDALFTVA